MADVVVLPGINRRDLVGEPTPSATVLNNAIDLGITDVVVVGRHRNGDQFIASSMANVDCAIGILFGAATTLAGGLYEQGLKEAPIGGPEGA